MQIWSKNGGVVVLSDKSFRNISLRADLIKTIEEKAVGKLGYRSIADFVSEAVRIRLEQLGLLGEGKTNEKQ